MKMQTVKLSSILSKPLQANRHKNKKDFDHLRFKKRENKDPSEYLTKEQ